MTTSKTNKTNKQANTNQAQASAQKSARTSRTKTAKPSFDIKVISAENAHGREILAVTGIPYTVKESFSILRDKAYDLRGTYVREFDRWHFSAKKPENAEEFAKFAREQFAKGKLATAERPAKKAPKKSGTKKATKGDKDMQAMFKAFMQFMQANA